MPPEVHSLTSLEAVAAGGPVGLRVTGRLARHVTAVAGADQATAGRPVAIDLCWHERQAGVLAWGEVHAAGLAPHPVFVLFADEDQGQWDLSATGRRALASRLRQRSLPPPATTAELLAAAEGWAGALAMGPRGG